MFSFHVSFKFTQSHVIIDAEHLPINNHCFRKLQKQATQKILGRDHMVVGFINTCEISAYHH